MPTLSPKTHFQEKFKTILEQTLKNYIPGNLTDLTSLLACHEGHNSAQGKGLKSASTTHLEWSNCFLGFHRGGKKCGAPPNLIAP